MQSWLKLRHLYDAAEAVSQTIEAQKHEAEITAIRLKYEEYLQFEASTQSKLIASSRIIDILSKCFRKSKRKCFEAWKTRLPVKEAATQLVIAKIIIKN